MKKTRLFLTTLLLITVLALTGCGTADDNQDPVQGDQQNNTVTQDAEDLGDDIKDDVDDAADDVKDALDGDDNQKNTEDKTKDTDDKTKMNRNISGQ